MKTTYLFIGFIGLALVQIFVPSQMIWKQEDVLKTGTMYKFKTMPVDPTDPFRGKYITLNYEMNSMTITDTSLTYGDKVRVYIDKDSQGFARAVRLSQKPLEINKDFVIARVTGNYKGIVNFELPFNRFYMEETKAKDAEIAYTKVNRDSLSQNVYAVVHIKEGRSVLKDVIIDGESIQEYVEK